MALIALGVSGGIGAYKAVEVCRGLQQRGHDVVAVMTRSAGRFVGSVTFEAITRRPVITSQWRPGMNADIEHIAIADQIALLVVAPCTANVIGKFANGIADDFLSTLYLATKAPVLLAPSMNTNMLAHAAVQRNLEALIARGVRFVEPGEGYLACGWVGKGRLAEPADIVAAADRIVAGAGQKTMAGKKMLITAGPTYEDIDAVRYVGNRSSGRMGFALAEEARRRGAEVTLVAGPTRFEPPAVDQLVRVRSAAEMHEAVMRAAARADVVIMAAAVADYAPAQRAADKIAKTDGPLTLTFERTKDILADLGGMRDALGGAAPVLIGFAAETADVVERARVKRARKNVDMIVANDVSADDRGFDAPSNEVTIITADNEEAIPLQSKERVAARILDRVESLLSARPAAPVRR
ncbi:MAG TPA: bifunctional phosphopantothenoylcysteine decarboxylase/phosphopantothenate--cysteine ligase CoaBC [Vicinamibacterales bacterium]|nr:bifunctional phosphopantothenoylcysteine decarboxylase/phosphopantothenate--cysteine ligase CoaBC [Vicinamibacterales bacterium]